MSIPAILSTMHFTVVSKQKMHICVLSARCMESRNWQRQYHSKELKMLYVSSTESYEEQGTGTWIGSTGLTVTDIKPSTHMHEHKRRASICIDLNTILF